MRRALLVLLVIAAQGCAAAIADPALPPGAVALTRANGEPLLVWDASTDIIGLKNAGQHGDGVIRTLESDAMRILTARAPALRGRVKVLHLRAIYAKTGAISPTYQVATFEGVEQLFQMNAPAEDLAGLGPRWSSLLNSGAVPPHVTIRLTGELPPEIR